MFSNRTLYLMTSITLVGAAIRPFLRLVDPVGFSAICGRMCGLGVFGAYMWLFINLSFLIYFAYQYIDSFSTKVKKKRRKKLG